MVKAVTKCMKVGLPRMISRAMFSLCLPLQVENIEIKKLRINHKYKVNENLSVSVCCIMVRYTFINIARR